jgi:hypothetical protein
MHRTGIAIVALASVVATGLWAAEGAWKAAPGPLTTRWTKDVTPENAWPEYPRPQMVRKAWQNLNGLWDFAMTAKGDALPAAFEKKILVPFAPESSLSGLAARVTGDNRLWYRRTFEVPAVWKGQRVLLHFGAVDWEAAVSVNGKEVGSHKGGYDPFWFDITDALKADGAQEVVVSAWDPTGPYAHGKQVLNPGGIMYTATSGIWRTVWLEAVPKTYASSLLMVPDVDAGVLRLTVKAGGGTVRAVATDEGKEVGAIEGKAGEELALPVKRAKLWTPDAPFLYGLAITLKDGAAEDRIESYFAMRKIAVGPDEKGITRLLLNGKFVFQVGPLDQGFWPDGLYTPPCDAAIKFDIEATKAYGFNMARKHVKVESDRWYYWCDKLGLLVWQDMASSENPTPEAKAQFEVELERVIEAYRNHPCIIMWVPFNEGWGQYDTERIVQKIKKQDPSRVVNNASGWTDMKCGDVFDAHTYPVPGSPRPEPKRAAVIGEYGGLGFNLAGHMWKKEGWGYQTFQNFDDLNARFEDLCLTLRKRVADPGISAAVYTQTSDIEVENNGLMTYDREVFKVDPKGSALALQGYAAPVREGYADVFIGEESVVLKAQRDDAEIRYTVDGSEPTASSTLYKEPIKVTAATTIKARSFWANGIASRTLTVKLAPTTAMVAVKPPASSVPGLKVTYYQNDTGKPWETLPDFKALTPTREAVATKIDLSAAKERNDHYALRFEGFLNVPATGVYVFHAVADDRARVTIDGKALIELDYTQGLKHFPVGLEAGAHTIIIEHTQSHGGKELRLDYSGPKGRLGAVAGDMLSH